MNICSRKGKGNWDLVPALEESSVLGDAGEGVQDYISSKFFLDFKGGGDPGTLQRKLVMQKKEAHELRLRGSQPTQFCLTCPPPPHACI